MLVSPIYRSDCLFRCVVVDVSTYHIYANTYTCKKTYTLPVPYHGTGLLGTEDVWMQ